MISLKIRNGLIPLKTVSIALRSSTYMPFKVQLKIVWYALNYGILATNLFFYWLSWFFVRAFVLRYKADQKRRVPDLGLGVFFDFLFVCGFSLGLARSTGVSHTIFIISRIK